MARKAKYGPYNRTDGQFPFERKLNGRNYGATATVTAFVRETERRMSALVLQSVQELVEDVQTPVGKGGKMRVDTGFLRASGQYSFNGMPTGPDRGRKREVNENGEPTETGQIYPDPTYVDLSQWTRGTTIYFGWTANYAIYREAYDGFLISGIQKWQSIVNSVCARIAQRSPANNGGNKP